MLCGSIPGNAVMYVLCSNIQLAAPLAARELGVTPEQGQTGCAPRALQYPFCAGGVNVAFMLVQLLELDRALEAEPAPPSTPAARGFLRLLAQDECAFEEVFAMGAPRLLAGLLLGAGQHIDLMRFQAAAMPV